MAYRQLGRSPFRRCKMINPYPGLVHVHPFKYRVCSLRYLRYYLLRTDKFLQALDNQAVSHNATNAYTLGPSLIMYASSPCSPFLSSRPAKQIIVD